MTDPTLLILAALVVACLAVSVWNDGRGPSA
jgi:hypothetical protein